MAIEVNGKTIETTDNGYLVDVNDWNEDVAKALAAEEGIELTREHWDVLNYLRDEYINNGGNQPMERILIKHMGDVWGKKIAARDLYKLFPLKPSKQGNLVAGLPETRRKGGY